MWKKTELPVSMKISGQHYTGSVKNYSFDGAFIKMSGAESTDNAGLLHTDISFTIDENTKYAVRPQGKIVRTFFTEKGIFLAVRFLDYMKEDE